MLQSLREKKSGLFVKAVLVLVVIGFSFFGIESYFISNVDTSAAKVGERGISTDEYQARFQEYRQQMMRMMGDNADPQYFEDPLVKRQVLDQLISEELLLQANDDLGVAIPASRLQTEIAGVSAFHTDGQFDPEVYRTVLAGQGMSPRGFEARVRRDLAVRELPIQVISSTLVTPAQVDAYLRVRDQRRDMSYVVLDAPVDTDFQPSEEQVDAYYNANIDQFTRPEMVALDYVELDESGLEVDMTPDESTLRERYEREKARFVTPEQRRAAHILIEVEGAGGPDEQRAAMTKAEDVAQQLRDGGDLAELAREFSADPGSRNTGGELGWIEQGMTEPAFEDALFALQQGDVSEPVLTPEGYHVIVLEEVREGSAREFDEVRTALEKEFVEGERERLYSDRVSRLLDLTYEDSSSLDSAARELGLTVERTPLATRQGGTDALTSDPRVMRAAFSDNVLELGNNSDPVDLGNGRLVVVRVAERKAPEPIPLAEVDGQIRAQLTAEHHAAQAREHADKYIAALRGGESLEDIAVQLDTEVLHQAGLGRDASNIDSALVDAVFAMPRPDGQGDDYKAVDLGDNRVALVRLEAVVDADPATMDEPTRSAARSTLQQAWSDAEVREFIALLRGEAKITINEKQML